MKSETFSLYCMILVTVITALHIMAMAQLIPSELGLTCTLMVYLVGWLMLEGNGLERWWTLVRARSYVAPLVAADRSKLLRKLWGRDRDELILQIAKGGFGDVPMPSNWFWGMARLDYESAYISVMLGPNVDVQDGRLLKRSWNGDIEYLFPRKGDSVLDSVVDASKFWKSIEG